jgi:aspartate/methionine/tyrosine aminotransferase
VFPPIEYLDFAHRWYGQVRFDLATSGIAQVAPGALGEPPRIDDYTARTRFRDAVAERYGVDAGEVVPSMGASGALFAAQATWLSPGDRLLVESPSYEPLWRSAQALGHPVDRFERAHGTRFALDVDAVLAGLKPQTRVVAVTNPHNPTGVVTDDATLRDLARALEERNVVLLVDEVYMELGQPRSTARRLGSNVITCSSATKCLGAGYVRAGWLLCPPERADDAARVERYVTGQAPPGSWALGEKVLARADALLQRAETIQRGKRTKIDRFLEQHAETLEWVPPPATGLFGWVRDRRGGDLMPRLERGITEHGVVVAPGSFFGDPSAFRLGWAGDGEKLEAALQILAQVLELGAGS